MLTPTARYAASAVAAGGLVLAVTLAVRAMAPTEPGITPIRADRTVTLSEATFVEPGADIAEGIAVVDVDAVQDYAVPVFEPPSPDVPVANFNLALSPRDAQPLVRIPPMMPTNATRSGWCDLDFDVGIDGRTRDVVATTCSDPVFTDAATRSVEQWRYQPRIFDGEIVPRFGMSSRVTFRLHDATGQVIPE